jgi:hypothetical protein
MARQRRDAYAEFDAMGLPEVRRRRGLHELRGLDYEWSESWIALREAEASDASQDEQIRMARSAKNAAWAAAIAAMIAVPIAIASIVISVLSLRAH